MKLVKWVTRTGLTCLVLAGCGTYQDPTYEPFQVSRPAPQPPATPPKAEQPQAPALPQSAALTQMQPIAEDGDERGDGFLETLMVSEIATIQSFLNASGFVAGMESGAFNHRTSTAIRSFQRANGLGVTGLPDMKLLEQAYAYFGDTPPFNSARETWQFNQQQAVEAVNWDETERWSPSRTSPDADEAPSDEPAEEWVMPDL